MNNRDRMSYESTNYSALQYVNESQNEGDEMEEIDDLQCNSVDDGYNLEELLCPNFSDSDETEQDSVTFDDSVVEAELLNSSSDDVVSDTFKNDLFDVYFDDTIAIDCSTIDAAEETELMETCSGDETDNPISVRRDDEVISEAKWNGFKLCGDNIDKTVKPRNMTITKQSQSFNYFNSYAVLDRIDMSLCSGKSILKEH